MDQIQAVPAPVERLEPNMAALAMQRLFKRAAKRLRKDHHLREDLVQEMSLAVVKCRKPHTLAFFVRRGVCRAINFLVRWERGKKRKEELDYEDERLGYDPIVLAARREAAIEEIKRLGMECLLEELSVVEVKIREAIRLAA